MPHRMHGSDAIFVLVLTLPTTTGAEATGAQSRSGRSLQQTRDLLQVIHWMGAWCSQENTMQEVHVPVVDCMDPVTWWHGVHGPSSMGMLHVGWTQLHGDCPRVISQATYTAQCSITIYIPCHMHIITIKLPIQFASFPSFAATINHVYMMTDTQHLSFRIYAYNRNAHRCVHVKIN